MTRTRHGHERQLWRHSPITDKSLKNAEAPRLCTYILQYLRLCKAALTDDFSDFKFYFYLLDATIALLKDLQKRYSIDSKRIYTTGQSIGCMSSIVLLLKEPEMFAGALLVAGKWNPSLMRSLANQNLWIISCEGDTSSNTLRGEAVALWRQQGSKVTEATWNMTLPESKLSKEADKMRAEGNHLLFTHLTGGNHRATWYVAYGIKSVQDWLFEQHREPANKLNNHMEIK